MIKQFNKVIKYFSGHPIASKSLLSTIFRFLIWQIFSSFYKKPIKVNWFDGARFYMKKGDHGLTGNYYTGLLDFYEMSFVLHFLRNTDLFIDVGANLGAYSILSSSVTGVKTFAFEPVPHTFQLLKKNIALNGTSQHVELFNYGVSNEKGSLSFSTDHDTVNHVVEKGTEKSIEVGVVKLDHLITLDVPALLKIDVEGFELFALQGADKILSNPHLKGIIIELNGSGKRYNIDDHEIDSYLVSKGFHPYHYDPFNRVLTTLQTFNSKDNTIYLRDLLFIKNRINTAKNVKIRGVEY